jgi:hypothetical protein
LQFFFFFFLLLLACLVCALETGSGRYIHTYIGLVRVGFIIVVYF